jgi:hypothetical protein
VKFIVWLNLLVKYQRNKQGGSEGMVVGQQKLKGLEFQTNLNTKSISKRICGENTRAPLSTEFEEHSNLCDKCIPVIARLVNAS